MRRQEVQMLLADWRAADAGTQPRLVLDCGRRFRSLQDRVTLLTA